MKKKKHDIEDELDDIVEIDEDSEHPVHEKFAKEKKLLK